MMTPTQRDETAEEIAQHQVCTLHIGGEQFALPLTDIVEVTSSVQLRDYPLSPAHIGGLMQYRGEVVAAVCLRTLLGMPRYSRTESSVILTGTRGLFALLVDKIGEVLSVTTASFESIPATVETQRQVLLAGTYKLNHGLLSLLDARKLEPSALRMHSSPGHRVGVTIQ